MEAARSRCPAGSREVMGCRSFPAACPRDGLGGISHTSTAGSGHGVAPVNRGSRKVHTQSCSQRRSRPKQLLLGRMMEEEDYDKQY